MSAFLIVAMLLVAPQGSDGVVVAKAKVKKKKPAKKKSVVEPKLPPRMKIFDVDASQAPMIKIFATFLDANDKVVPIKMLKRLQVVVLKGRTGSRQEVLREFHEGRVKKGERGAMKTFGKMKGKLGVVVVAAGHGAEEYKNGTLGQMQRQGLELFFKKLGKQDKVQFIWYNDKLRLYSSERESELVEYTDLRCNKPREDKKKKKKGAKKEKKPGTTQVPETVCAPTTEFGKFKKTLKKLKYEGRNPKLVDAINLAIKLLIKTPNLPRQKAIIILSDGLIGNLAQFEKLRSSLAEAQRFGTSKKRRVKRRRKRGKKKTEVVQKVDYKKLAATIQTQMNKIVVSRHELFRRYFVKWLPLCKAANIRVFVVGYPNSTKSDLRPLKILAFKTGGTFRYAPKVETLEAVYEEVVKELTDSYVIAFNSKLKTGQAYQLLLKGSAAGDTYSTPRFRFFMPTLPGGLKYWVKQKWLWLQAKVGYVPALIIVIAVALLLLIIVLLLIKKILKMIWEKTGKKLVDKAKKGAGDAAKGAAKGATKR
ncbi:MAG: hypothetical protein KC609_01865 [Myxococcales bacterium]|nr:hypothetical protein [Myxococcales bacterium]